MVYTPFTRYFFYRWTWLLVCGAVLGAVGGLVASGWSVSATSAFSVESTSLQPEPNQSNRLASTYARLLPEEPALVDGVADITGESQSAVRKHLTMVAQPRTSVVFARYSGDSR